MALRMFPPLLLRERGIIPELTGNTVGAGRTAAGVFPLVRNDGGGLWRIELAELDLFGRPNTHAYRAMMTAFEAGATPLIVPIRDTRHAPWPLVGGVELQSIVPVPHSDGEFFSDGTGYAQNAIVATLAADAELRATEVTIAIDLGEDLLSGEFFALQHATYDWRLYHIIGCEQVAGDWVCQIRPPLREAVSAGQHVEFDMPRCVMQLASPGSARMDMRSYNTPSPVFIEAFPPFE